MTHTSQQASPMGDHWHLTGIFLKPLRDWDYPNKLPFVPERRCLLVHNSSIPLFGKYIPKKQCTGGGQPLRVRSRTQPRPISITSRADITTRYGAGSSMQIPPPFLPLLPTAPLGTKTFTPIVTTTPSAELIT